MRLMILTKKLIGKTVATPIYMYNGMVLLNAGGTLSENTIEKLINIGVSTVYIEDDSCVIELQEMLEARVKLEILNDIKILFDKAEKSKKLDCDLAEKIVINVIQNINLSENAVLYNNISSNNKNGGQELIMHSFEVMIYSLITGISRKYDQKKLLHLGLGALLHDIGKLFVSGEMHTVQGYDFAKAQLNIPTTSYVCILQHHECEDGSGFPNKLEGEKIYELSKVVGICNDYVNLLHNAKTALVSEAVEVMTARATVKFDQQIFKDFFNSIYVYPNGTEVRFNNKRTGIVVKQNKNLPTRPIVAMLEQGKPILIDLTKELTTFIEEVIL